MRSMNRQSSMPWLDIVSTLLSITLTVGRPFMGPKRGNSIR